MPRYIFTEPDYAVPFRENAARVLQDYKSRPINYLEIGVFEGRSGVWMLDNVLLHDESRYVGVDAYQRTVHGERAAIVHEQARRNLSRHGKKASLHHATSLEYLSRVDQEMIFDVIYIDGNHKPLGVSLDLCLTWPLLKHGGILAFDDWRHPRSRGLHRVVGALVRELPLEVIVNNYQLWVRKT